MFNFKATAALAIIAITTIHATDGKYPITPNEVADIHNLGAGVNTPDSEYTPFITPDEKFLFFQSNREPATGPEGDFDLWYSLNKNAGTAADPLFEQSANVGAPINSESLDGHPTLRKLPTGEFEMYFSSFAAGTRTGPQLTNIYYTVWRGGKWSVPQPVAELNSDFHDRMPSISQDGRYIFFSSDRPGGHGGDDIWFSELDMSTGKWGAPQNAGNINTPASEVTPAIHTDGVTLYFSSNQAGGVGGYDIYFTQSVGRLENPNEAHILTKGWSKPINLGKPFNSEFDDEYPTVTANGARVYFTSNRVEGKGAFDIYRARVPDFARPTAKLMLTGKTLVAGSRRPLSASVAITAGPVTAAGETSSEKGAGFTLDLISQRVYKLVAEAKGFKTISEEVDTRTLHDKGVERELLFVRDIKIPKTVSLKLSFADADGKNVAPSAKVKVSPRDAKASKFKAGSVIALTDIADFGGSEEKALLALEAMVIEVSATKKGYQPLKDKVQVGSLLDKYTGELPEVLDLTIAMARKGEAVQPKAEEPAEKEEPVKQEITGKNYLKFLGRIYFNTNDSEKPVGKSEATVKKTAAEWKKNPGRRIFVYGHGDSRGTVEYNRKLSKARANLIRKQLIKQGVAARKITAQGAGKSQRKVKNDNTEAKRKKNRRVEIYITEPVAEQTPAPAAEAKPGAAEEPKAEPAAKESPAAEPAKAEEAAPGAAESDKPAAPAENTETAQ